MPATRPRKRAHARASHGLTLYTSASRVFSFLEKDLLRRLETTGTENAGSLTCSNQISRVGDSMHYWRQNPFSRRKLHGSGSNFAGRGGRPRAWCRSVDRSVVTRPVGLSTLRLALHSESQSLALRHHVNVDDDMHDRRSDSGRRAPACRPRWEDSQHDGAESRRLVMMSASRPLRWTRPG
jgi:hypothetical protein